MGLDCGPKSRKLFSEPIGNANTIIWNGPLGVFEFDKFAQGTKVYKIFNFLSFFLMKLLSPS